MARTQARTDTRRQHPVPAIRGRRPLVPRRGQATAPVRGRGRAPEPEPVESEIPLKPRTVQLINSIRRPFEDYVVTFTRMSESCATLAPKFMAALAAFKADTGKGLINFVRELDPTVPENRDPNDDNDGYKNHPSYTSAFYLQRLAGGAGDGDEREESDENSRPVSMSLAFVRLLAAIIALVPGNQVEKVWGIVGEELHWSERRVETLREQVEEVEPLIEARPERNHLSVEAVH